MAGASASRSPLVACFLLALAPVLIWRSPLAAFAGAGGAALQCGRDVSVSMAGKAKDGIFTPIVQGAKVIVGENEIKQLRAKVIKAHGELMANFIQTSDSPMGDLALRKLFEAADTDGNGTLDPQELQVALNRLGFTWMDETKAGKAATKGDANDDGVIDYEEFKKMAPTMLKQNLMKLAKENGGEMGLLS